MESIDKTIIEKRPVNSGFLYGPFCPIYGFAAVFMIALISHISKNIFITFFICMILLTLWEYIVAVVLEKIFKTKYWDYSDIPFNFQGRICLKNSIYWGILGTLFIYVLHPLIQSKVELISNNILLQINIVIYVILIIDVIVTVTKILFIDKKIEQLYEISNTIKEKINELKQQELSKVSTENITAMIIELKQKQHKIKRKIYRLIIRLRRAFPTMKSESISKFVNEKIDFKGIKNKIRKNKEE